MKDIREMIDKIKNINKLLMEDYRIDEAIPPSRVKQYMKIQRDESVIQKLNEIFLKLSQIPGAKASKRVDRVYLKYVDNHDFYDQHSITYNRIVNALEQTDFKLMNYTNGIAVDKYNRQVKLGKVLTRLNLFSLLNEFNTDPVRESSKEVDKIVVFSRHPYDIAGMSTDRGWRSCMNIYDGSKKEYVDADVKNGTIICYLTRAEDLNLKKPIARVLIKPYISDENDVFYFSETYVYGTASTNFSEFVQKIMEEIQGKKFGYFYIKDDLYCDRLPENILKLPEKNSMTEKKYVEKVLNILKVKNYTIKNDLTVDVDGDVNLMGVGLTEIPIQFDVVKGNFVCVQNKLTTLQGSPSLVEGSFNCSMNSLTTLLGAPRRVGGDFICNFNGLVSLVDGPSEVGGDYDCLHNNLTSLKGSPRSCKSFNCSSNLLESLEGAPEKAKIFTCAFNTKKFTEEEVRAVCDVIQKPIV